MTINSHRQLVLAIMLLLLLLPTAQLLLGIVETVVIPIIPSESDSIRVFCFADSPNKVSFSRDRQCESTCGYYDGQSSCCKVLLFSKDSVVRCYHSGNKTLEFTASIMPIRSKQYRTKTQSELICAKVAQDQINHATQSFYMKYAYLYDGKPKIFNKFFNLELIKLPADESEVECNRTKYAFYAVEYNAPCNMILQIISILGTIFLIFIHRDKIPINKTN